MLQADLCPPIPTPKLPVANTWLIPTAKLTALQHLEDSPVFPVSCLSHTG